MTSKRFVFLSFCLTFAVVSLFVCFNLYMNEFGLYGDAHGKQWRIWTYNRASKYLFSLNYIPANFDGILIGSSSSAVMLDTRKIKGARLYNLSMNGANACEVAAAAINALERGKMKYLIVCLDPYFFKDSMMKTSEFSSGLEKSLYGSLFTIRFYLYKLTYMLFPESDPYRESWWGYRMIIGDAPPVVDMERPGAKTEYFIDPKALKCLQEVLCVARKEGVSILAYSHPKPNNEYLANMNAYADFLAKIAALFSPLDQVWSFNTPEFAALTGNATSFSDHVHLSETGAEMVMQEIEKRLSVH
ncbi:MAG: hypothetical protein AB7E32_00420 [Desulfovibrio sp.]